MFKVIQNGQRKCDRGFRMALAVVSMQNLCKIVWYVEFVMQKKCFSKAERYFRRKNLHHALKNVMNCPSLLPVLPPVCLENQILVQNFSSFDHVCVTVF